MATFEAPRPAGVAARDPAPHLGRISLRNYRNFERLDCELPGPGVVIVGPNGSGKTNLLEAIYYLEVFRSFRGAKDAELVRFDESVFRIEASLEGADARSVAAAYDRRGRRKKVELEGRELDRLSDGIGKVGAALFRLEDAEIVRGGPGERRRFLDVVLSLTEPGYLAALQRYRAVLSQRNEALKAGAGPSAVGAWTEGLVAAGGRVLAARARWVREGEPAFRSYHSQISGGGDAGMTYASSVRSRSGPDGGPGRREAWADRFREALEASADRERRRGVTVVGPHRDDVRFVTRDGDEVRELRTFGSSGQQRTAALALRLVEADGLRARLEREPIYLLDDIFAELDESRSRRVLELLEEGRSGQVIITAPKASELELRGGALERWRIRNGRILA